MIEIVITCSKCGKEERLEIIHGASQARHSLFTIMRSICEQIQWALAIHGEELEAYCSKECVK